MSVDWQCCVSVRCTAKQMSSTFPSIHSSSASVPNVGVTLVLSRFLWATQQVLWPSSLCLHFCCACGMGEFQVEGWKLSHSSDQARSSTHWASRDLPWCVSGRVVCVCVYPSILTYPSPPRFPFGSLKFGFEIFESISFLWISSFASF